MILSYADMLRILAKFLLSSIILSDRLDLLVYVISMPIGVRHSKIRSAPHCMVLPPGEFNSMI